jgi:hypothetical protein
MEHLGMAKANTAVGVSHEDFLLLLHEILQRRKLQLSPHSSWGRFGA